MGNADLPQILRVRLDRLNIPAEALRRGSAPREEKRLTESIHRLGVLAPLLVRSLGRGEYDVWDGARRVLALRALGAPGSTEVPALVLPGDDARGVIVQMAVNQVRERLSALAEAEAARQLVEDHGWERKAAAAELGKTKGWTSQVLEVFRLPARVMADLRRGRFSLAHARVLARVLDRPRLFAELYRLARKRDISARQLSVLARRGEKEGISAVRREATRQVSVGARSWLRLEPLLTGMRVELHLDRADDAEAVLAEVRGVLAKRR